jgi:hypothetical protein
MKTIATLDPENAKLLAAFLAKHGFGYETRDSTDENGLDTAELLVQDDIYESACEATERWEAEMTAANESKSRRRCPTCHSPHLEFVKDFDYDKSITGITEAYRCKDCNRVFVPRY